MIHLEIKETEAKTRYMDAKSLNLLVQAWELNSSMIQALRSAQSTLDENEIDSQDITELLEEANLKFGPESPSGRNIAASIAGLEALIDLDGEGNGLEPSLGHEIVVETDGEFDIPDINALAAGETEDPPVYEEEPPVYGDAYEEQVIPPSYAV